MAEIDGVLDVKAPGSMLVALNRDLRSADWLDADKDGTNIELALHYAALIDTSKEAGSLEALQRTMAIAGPNLHKALTSLGLTPASRSALAGGEKEKPRSTFDELKKRRQKRATA
ncbi:terminase small subunit [Dermabacteraceae bacterium P13138]|nr:hypothetical protein [Dermabacteraceae bacterium TAE3-ERU27]